MHRKRTHSCNVVPVHPSCDGTGKESKSKLLFHCRHRRLIIKYDLHQEHLSIKMLSCKPSSQLVLLGRGRLSIKPVFASSLMVHSRQIAADCLRVFIPFSEQK